MSSSKINEAVFLKRILASNFSRGFPYKLTFALTYKCNLKCVICGIWQRQPENELSLEEITRFFKNSNSFSWLDLTGGEIFLREDLEDIINAAFFYCRRLCVLHFPTNGQLPEKVISLAGKIRGRNKAKLIITVSLDGPEAVHDRIRGSSGAWQKAVRAFTGLKEAGLKNVYIGYTLSEYNRGKIDETFLAVKEKYPGFKYDDLHMNFFHNSGHYLNNALMRCLPESSVMEEFKMVRQKKQDQGIKGLLEKRYAGLIPGYLATKKMPIKCRALRASVFMDPCGNIFPCSIYDKKFANIRQIDYRLANAWKDKKNLAGIENNIRNKECPGCWTACEAYPAILGSLLPT